MTFNQKQMKKILLSELKKAEAKVTHRRVACLLESFKGSVYTGHNFEKTIPMHFYHAEDMAINKMERSKDKSGIKNIIMAGYGRLNKYRQVSPCENCFKLLKPYFKKQTKLTIYEPNTHKYPLKFSLKEILKSYAKIGYSKISGNNLSSIKKSLKEKTLLKRKDILFAAGLRLLGLKNHIKFYLTGSSSGRTGLVKLIKEKQKKSYDDIDIVIISNK